MENPSSNTDLIPCEICNELIHFNEYQEHINSCSSPISPILLPLSYITDFLNNINTDINNLVDTQDVVLDDNDTANNNQDNTDIDDYINDNIDDDIDANIEDDVASYSGDSIDSDDIGVSDYETDENEDEEFENYLNPDNNNISLQNLINLTQENRNAIAELITRINNINFETTNSNINIDSNLSTLNNMSNNYYFHNGFLINDNNNHQDSYESLTNLSEQIGDVKIGVKNIKDIYDDYIISINEEFECIVCKEDFCGNYKVCKLNKCGHIYCKSCVNKWFQENKKCPVCQYEYE